MVEFIILYKYVCGSVDRVFIVDRDVSKYNRKVWRIGFIVFGFMGVCIWIL